MSTKYDDSPLMNLTEKKVEVNVIRKWLSILFVKVICLLQLLQKSANFQKMPSAVLLSL